MGSGGPSVEWGLALGKPRGPAKVSSLGPNYDLAGPLSFEGRRGAFAPRLVPPVPGYGRDPVGNGHAAAGFSAVLALGVAAVDGGAA
jgi:hypothetical protein